MICIPISPASNDQAAELLALAATEPADLIEIRMDCFDERPDLPRLLALAQKPLLATCRSKAEGGKFNGDIQDRTSLLQEAIDLGFPYVDAEADCLPGLRRSSESVTIASWHDFTSVPADLDEKIKNLCDLPGDWVKFAVMATSHADNLRVFDAIGKASKPAIGIAMGEFGETSRILGPSRGSRITFGSLRQGEESAPGQLTARELADLYRVKSLTRDTAVYGLVGDPVGHSMGHRIHNAAFAAAGVDAVYIRWRAPNFVDFMERFAVPLGVAGLSVTIPHKEAALRTAGMTSPLARDIGAANTLTSLPHGGWRGDNTDAAAAIDSISAAARGSGIVLTGKDVLVIGAGGVARALGLGLDRLGCRVTLANRTPERARSLALEMGWRTVEMADVANHEWMLVVNATSVGMHPNISASPFPADGWRAGMMAFDTIYCPRRTRFVREAEASGVIAIDGTGMFLGQAARQFELWTGRTAPRETMRLAAGLE